MYMYLPIIIKGNLGKSNFFFYDEKNPLKYHNYLNICYDSFQINVWKLVKYKAYRLALMSTYM